MIASRPYDLLAIAMAVLVLTFGQAGGAVAQEQVARGVRLPAATVVDAATRRMIETVPINGSLVARETVAVMPQVTGYQIVEVFADVGSQVEKGQVLVRLDRAPLETQLKQAEAEIASATAAIAQNRSQIAGQDATLNQAATVLERTRRLVESGAGTQSALDDAETQFAGATASLQGARDALASAEAQGQLAAARRDDIALQLQRTDVVAPVSGIVATRGANIGQTAGMDTTAMFTIIRDGEIEFDGMIIETALSKVKAGQTAMLSLSGFPARTGTVRLLSPNVDPATRLGSVRIELDGAEVAESGLPIGIFASALLTVAERDAVSVPLSAIVPSAEGNTVQVVDAEGVLDVRPVVTGIVEGAFVEVAEGLAEGETVVAKAGPFFRGGMKIRAVPTEAPPAVASGPTTEEADLSGGRRSGSPEAVAR